MAGSLFPADSTEGLYLVCCSCPTQSAAVLKPISKWLCSDERTHTQNVPCAVLGMRDSPLSSSRFTHVAVCFLAFTNETPRILCWGGWDGCCKLVMELHAAARWWVLVALNYGCGSGMLLTGLFCSCFCFYCTLRAAIYFHLEGFFTYHRHTPISAPLLSPILGLPSQSSFISQRRHFFFIKNRNGNCAVD